MKARKLIGAMTCLGFLALLWSVGISAQPEPVVQHEQVAQPEEKVTQAERDAARFLAKATFGPNMNSIRDVASLGQRAWLERQLALPPTYHGSFVRAASRLIENTAELQLERLVDDEEGDEEQLEDRIFELYEDFGPTLRRFAWWDRTLYAPAR